MKLSEWARANGVHPPRPRCAGSTGARCRCRRAGLDLAPSWEAGPGSRSGGVALYARVSSHDQRADLERQLGRLVTWAAEQGMAVTQTVSEVGSGMNGARPRLRRLLADPSIGCIVVEHRDRLARLGAEYIEAALQ